MAVTFDTSSSAAKETAGSSLTFSATVNTGSNRILVVGAFAYDDITGPGASVITGITFNSNALTAGVQGYYTDGASFDVSYELWYLIAPTQTTANVVISYTGAVNHIHAFAASFFGVKQTSPMDDSDSIFDTTGTTHSLTLTTTDTGNVLVDVNGSDHPLTLGASQNSVMDLVSHGYRGSYKIVAGAGNYDMTETTTVNSQSGHAAISLLPAASAGVTLHLLSSLGAGS